METTESAKSVTEESGPALEPGGNGDADSDGHKVHYREFMQSLAKASNVIAILALVLAATQFILARRSEAQAKLDQIAWEERMNDQREEWDTEWSKRDMVLGLDSMEFSMLDGRRPIAIDNAMLVESVSKYKELYGDLGTLKLSDLLRMSGMSRHVMNDALTSEILDAAESHNSLESSHDLRAQVLVYSMGCRRSSDTKIQDILLQLESVKERLDPIRVRDLTVALIDYKIIAACQRGDVDDIVEQLDEYYDHYAFVGSDRADLLIEKILGFEDIEMTDELVEAIDRVSNLQTKLNYER